MDGDHVAHGGTPVARLMRHVDGAWRPIGDPLPPFEHAPPDPTLVVALWVLPREPPAQPGDVLTIAEVAHQLLARCERDDPVYVELAEQTMLFRSVDETMAWLSEVEVWIGRRLAPDLPWPTHIPT